MHVIKKMNLCGVAHAVCMLGSGAVSLAQMTSLPACPSPGDESTSIDIFRDKCQAKVRYKTGVYIGEFQNNQRNGQGVFLFTDGARYVGTFRDGQPDGRGTYSYPSGERYVGEFRSNKREGQGTFYAADGTRLSSGTWSNDRFIANYADPKDAASDKKLTGSEQERSAGRREIQPPRANEKVIQMQRLGDNFIIPIRLNDSININALLDTGAEMVVIPADVLSALQDDYSLSPADHIRDAVMVDATGRKTSTQVVLIRSIQIGDVKIENIPAIVGYPKTAALLGQSLLVRFNAWSVDNSTHQLILK